MTFAQCSDYLFLKFKNAPGGPRSNKQVALAMIGKGIADATEYKVKRRWRRMRQTGRDKHTVLDTDDIT